MLPTHHVPCPRCAKPLYSAVSLEDGVNAGAVESPKIEKDSKGYYMKCPHCAERIAMARVTERESKAFQPLRARSGGNR